MFKFCGCDCGHGSLKKDADYVPPRPQNPAPDNNNQEAGAAGGAPAQAAEKTKKKKKEKVNLKPKLNFNVQNQSGSYFGSARQKEEEEELASRKMRRLSSSEKSDSGSSSTIPGLMTPAASKPASPALSRSSSSSKSARKNSSVSEGPGEMEEGWVRVSSSRRGSQSQQDLSQHRQNTEAEVFPSLPPATKPPTTQNSKPQITQQPPPASKPEAKVKDSPAQIKLVPKEPPPKTKPPPIAAPKVPQLPELAPQEPTSPVEVKQLPMFKPSPPDRFYETSSASSLRYQTGIQPPIGSQQGRRTSSTSPGHNLGARPKFSPTLSDEVYHSDEDIPFGDWIDPTVTDKDKDMDDLFNQTRQFERNLSLLTPDRTDKRDSNGFFNCRSCQTVYSAESEYEAHLRSDEHEWGERLRSGPVSVSTLKGGWESISLKPDTWQPPDSYVKGVTTEEFAEFNRELKKFKEQLEKEKKEKDELIEKCDELKNKYEEEVKAKEEVVNRMKTLKAETLRLAIEEKGKFEATIVKSKKDVQALKENVDSLTQELKDLRIEEETSSKKRLTSDHSKLEKEMKLEITNLKRAKEDVESKYKDLSSKYNESQKALQETKTNHELTKKEKENVDRMLAQQTIENNTTAERLKEELRKKITAEVEVARLKDKLEAKEEIEESYKREIEVLKTGLDKIKTFNETLEQELGSHEKNLAEIEDLKKKLGLFYDKEKDDFVTEDVEVTEKDIGQLNECLPQPMASKEQTKDVQQEQEKNEDKSMHETEERNSVFDLFDEINSQRKKKATVVEDEDVKPDNEEQVNTRRELSNIINDSIKDEALRNCLSSIISQGEDEVTKDDAGDNDQGEDGPDPYDTLDRIVQPGLDDEIDPYLGEDEPGEFDNYLSDSDNEHEDLASKILLQRTCVNETCVKEQIDQEHADINALSKTTEPEAKEIIQTISDSDDDDAVAKETNSETSSDSNMNENEEDGIMTISSEDEDPLRNLEPEKPKPFVISTGDLGVSVVSNDVIELDLHPEIEKPVKYRHWVDQDDMENIQMLRVSMPCISDRHIMRAEYDMGKKMEDMNDEELKEHMRLLAEMTKDDVFNDPLLHRPWPHGDIAEDDASLDMIHMPLENPPEAGDTAVDFSSRKTSLSSLSSSNSTQHDASSLCSDSPIPESSSLGQDEPRVASLERTVTNLQSLVMSLADQVATLTNKMDDSNFEAGLLNKTVEMLQKKNTKLTESVEILESQNEAMEKKLKEAQKSSSNNEVNGLRESFLEILASCETFQTSFDSMSDRQVDLDDKLESIKDNFDKANAENQALRKEFDSLAKDVTSLTLEFQVDKGQTKRLMDGMAYSLTALTNNKNAGSVESSSSTSGVKSDEISDSDDLDKVGSLAFLDLKENPTETKAGSSKTEAGANDKKTITIKKIKTNAAPGPTIPPFAPLPPDPGAAVLHYGGVLPPGVPPPVQSPQQGAQGMVRPPTLMTTRMPIVYPHFGNQIFSHGTGAVSYPSFYYAPR